MQSPSDRALPVRGRASCLGTTHSGEIQSPLLRTQKATVCPDRGSPRPALTPETLGRHLPPSVPFSAGAQFCPRSLLGIYSSPPCSEPSGPGVPLGAVSPGATSGTGRWERDLKRGETEGAFHWPSALAPKLLLMLRVSPDQRGTSVPPAHEEVTQPLFRDESSLVSGGLRQPDQPGRSDRQVREVPGTVGRAPVCVVATASSAIREVTQSRKVGLPPESWSRGPPFSLSVAFLCPGLSEASWAWAQLLPILRPDPRGEGGIWEPQGGQAGLR